MLLIINRYRYATDNNNNSNFLQISKIGNFKGKKNGLEFHWNHACVADYYFFFLFFSPIALWSIGDFPRTLLLDIWSFNEKNRHFVIIIIFSTLRSLFLRLLSLKRLLWKWMDGESRNEAIKKFLKKIFRFDNFSSIDFNRSLIETLV